MCPLLYRGLLNRNAPLCKPTGSILNWIPSNPTAMKVLPTGFCSHRLQCWGQRKRSAKLHGPKSGEMMSGNRLILERWLPPGPGSQ